MGSYSVYYCATMLIAHNSIYYNATSYSESEYNALSDTFFHMLPFLGNMILLISKVNILGISLKS